jgi:hypothetical protein
VFSFRRQNENSGVVGCKLQYSMLLISDATSESDLLCHSIPGKKSSIHSQAMVPRMLAL